MSAGPSAQPIGEPAPLMQQAPLEGRRAGAPILPPLMAPTQPAWKEPKPETVQPEVDAAPETAAPAESTE